MSSIKVSKKYKNFGYTSATEQDINRYKERMVVSSKEERDAHNAAVEAKKKAKHEQKLHTN